MNLIITLIIVLLFSYLFTSLAKKIRIPSVVALIFAGLIIGFPFINKEIIAPNEGFIFVLGDIGLLCLMFLAGLESSWKILKTEKKDAFFIAIFAALIPFILGFVIFLLLGFPLEVSLIVGIAISITAEATKARVLLELKKLRTRVGSAMMGAGIIDDILGLVLFITVTVFFKTAHAKEDMLIAGAIIAFFIGVIVPTNAVEKKSWARHMENVLILTIIPFFFISMGLHFDLSSLFLDPILLILILVIAISGKLIGALLIKPFTNFKLKQLYLIGWGMNSRGAIELAIVLLAFRTGLIPVGLYSSLIIMALVTTIIFPFIITRMIKKNPQIMN